MSKLPNIFEANTEPVQYKAGEIIFSAGDAGDSMYVVKQGSVDLVVGESVVETVETEGFFGEMALIEGGARSASAIARTDCTLVPINQKRFDYMLGEVPFFAMHILKVFSKRLRRIDAAKL